ncbi:MAG: hypothetical protein GYB55_22350 [Cytophagales bacterium]|uniref:hypothetical protein n=1 Tax=Cyclobacterium marinum TaxID=104 RepID=UPI0011EEBF39|nr:hypothetical protein [Cyclobacterium marinum]MBI0398627.1 hypothetical protein [Cyclobacterium marinum]MBR9777613.1 hypothetical protein [Cytophagales bacterium]|tara:strand:+ start:60006 stop:60428 length:423 start_codon:yes stop_codon:yes gene_type:complete
MKYLVLIIGMLSFSAYGQQENVWKYLSKVSYEVEEDEFGELFVPVFGEKTLELEGKEITADGYIIPFEGMFKPKHIILSALPLAECFFCGTGGPETVMEVMLNEPIKYTSKKVSVVGELVLNANDPEKLMYILENAKIID